MSLDEDDLLLKIKESSEEKTFRLMYADYLAENERYEEEKVWRQLPHQYTTFDCLIGQTVLEVALAGNYIKGDSSYLRIITNGDTFYFFAEGDCCSSSWFYRMKNIKALIGQEVIAIAEGDNSDINTDDGLTQQESDSAYSTLLLTRKGGTDITFRNSSNGYYGGTLVREDNSPNMLYSPITEDWIVPPKEKEEEIAMGCSSGVKINDYCECDKCFFKN